MAYVFREGDPPGICMRCGFKFHVSQLRREWTGMRVCHGVGTNDCWEARNQQDFVRGVPDPQQVPGGPVPEPPDVFVDPEDILASAL